MRRESSSGSGAGTMAPMIFEEAEVNPYVGGLKLFADGADLELIARLRSHDQRVKGFTTNPTLMHKAGVPDYLTFAHEAAVAADPLPISLEVLADDLETIEYQARRIAEIGSNVFVKI